MSRVKPRVDVVTVFYSRNNNRGFVVIFLTRVAVPLFLLPIRCLIYGAVVTLVFLDNP